MKKLVFAVMAAVAIGFASCGNKTQAPVEAVDSVALIDSLAEEAFAETESALNSVFEAKDIEKFKEVIAQHKEKIAELLKENPELAKACLNKLQAFLKANEEKVKNTIGESKDTQSAVDALIAVNAEDGLAGLIGEMVSTKENAEKTAQEQVDNAQDAAKQKAEENKEAAKQKAAESVDAAADKAKKALGL